MVRGFRKPGAQSYRQLQWRHPHPLLSLANMGDPDTRAEREAGNPSALQLHYGNRFIFTGSISFLVAPFDGCRKARIN